jgi:hypothetical protein
MRLPYAELAVLPFEKVTGYLLNDAHPEGRSKAAFFQRVGFRTDEPHILRRALLDLAPVVDVEEIVFTFGRKYIGVGIIRTPSGREVAVVTVWVLRRGQPPPYFVTAYPA